MPTYVLDPAVLTERVRALTERSNRIRHTYYAVMLHTFGDKWTAVAQALNLRGEHENPMRALDLLEEKICQREEADTLLSKTLGVEA